jgi:hypothetical protein
MHFSVVDKDWIIAIQPVVQRGIEIYHVVVVNSVSGESFNVSPGNVNFIKLGSIFYCSVDDMIICIATHSII